MSGASVSPLPARVARPVRFPVTVFRDGTPLLEARIADTFVARLRGLHALPPLGPLQALIIRPCDAVQTWTMRAPIDVAFLDREGRVLTRVGLPPRRLFRCGGAYAAMEMAEGTIARLGLRNGERLDVVEDGDGGEGETGANEDERRHTR